MKLLFQSLHLTKAAKIKTQITTKLIFFKLKFCYNIIILIQIFLTSYLRLKLSTSSVIKIYEESRNNLV